MYKQAMKKWLESMDWDLWATLTFRYNASKPAVRRAVERYMIKLRPTSSKLDYIVVVEDTGTNNHVHALIRGTSQASNAQALWNSTNGLAKVRRYSRGGGAAGYVCKHLHLPTTDWWIG